MLQTLQSTISPQVRFPHCSSKPSSSAIVSARLSYCTIYKNKQSRFRHIIRLWKQQAEHKMSKVLQCCVILGMLCAASCQTAETDAGVRQGKTGFLNGATTILTSLAQDLVSRSAANSQVLSLNLTNLFILLVLKAIIFGAGAFGYGGHGGYGRKVDGLLKEDLSKNLNFEEFLSESELLLMLSYLKADSTQKFDCLQRVACEDPRKAKQYVFTGKLLLKGSELLTQSPLGFKYDNILSHLDDAISYGLKGQDCGARYKCEQT